MYDNFNVKYINSLMLNKCRSKFQYQLIFSMRNEQYNNNKNKY